MSEWLFSTAAFLPDVIEHIQLQGATSKTILNPPAGKQIIASLLQHSAHIFASSTHAIFYLNDGKNAPVDRASTHVYFRAFPRWLSVHPVGVLRLSRDLSCRCWSQTLAFF